MTGTLDGIRVLDLSRVLAGPFCTMTLGDLGAEVIKVERPGVGDDLRNWGPPFGPTGDATYFLAVNRNKHGIAVDLRTTAGRDIIRELAAVSDVVVENFRVGTLDKMGLGYDELSKLNPGLVYCSISGYGQSGPWAGRPGYDVMAQAVGGLMSVTGEPDGQPMRVGIAIVDLCTGLYAAVGILAALQARSRTGRGQRVDLSLLEVVLASLPNLTAGYLIAGDVPQRLGTGHPNVTPYGVFPTRDGYIVIAAGNDGHWKKLCIALKHAEKAADLRYAKNSERMARRNEVEDLVRAWCIEFTTEELSALFTEQDVPHSPVNTIPDILAHFHTEAIGAVREYPLGGEHTGRMVRPPFTFSQDERTTHVPPPSLGEETHEVLKRLGYSDERISELSAEGAFGSN